MKKQIGFYILWDALLFLALYIHYAMSIWSKQVSQTSGYEVRYDLLVQALLPMLLGFLVALLISVSFRFEMTKKIALAEFLIVGIPTLYVGTIAFAPMFLLHWFSGPIPPFGPFWLTLNITAAGAGSVIFGYELVILFVRLIRIKNDRKQDVFAK